MFTIKIGEFYYVCYDQETDETIYSSSTYSAKKFKTLDTLDEYCLKKGIFNYSVVIVDG